MTPPKWKLVSKTDVSPSKWFPLEKRSYVLADGKVVDDFFVTTIQDASMVVPITKDKKVVMVKQYKPGVDEITLEFPAGRLRQSSDDPKQLALHELEEEVGIKTTEANLTKIGRVAGFSTKSSECVHLYLAPDLEFNSSQRLDPNENIEIVQLTFDEMRTYIQSGEINNAQTIAAWHLYTSLHQSK